MWYAVYTKMTMNVSITRRMKELFFFKNPSLELAHKLDISRFPVVEGFDD